MFFLTFIFFFAHNIAYPSDDNFNECGSSSSIDSLSNTNNKNQSNYFSQNNFSLLRYNTNNPKLSKNQHENSLSSNESNDSPPRTARTQPNSPAKSNHLTQQNNKLSLTYSTEQSDNDQNYILYIDTRSQNLNQENNLQGNPIHRTLIKSICCCSLLVATVAGITIAVTHCESKK